MYYFALLWYFVKLYEEKKSLVYLTYEVLSKYCQDHKGFYLKTSLKINYVSYFGSEPKQKCFLLEFLCQVLCYKQLH